MALFTVESARQAGLKSARTRFERQQAAKEREAVIDRAVDRLMEPVEKAIAEREDSTKALSRKLARLERQLDRLDGLIDDTDEPPALRDLTNARARLFDQWAHLAGIPKPGSRRPGREPRARMAPPAEPTPSETPQGPPGS
jgi:hypothetical protein